MCVGDVLQPNYFISWKMKTSGKFNRKGSLQDRTTEEVYAEYIPEVLDSTILLDIPKWVKIKIKESNGNVNSYIRSLIYKEFYKNGVRNPNKTETFLADDDIGDLKAKYCIGGKFVRKEEIKNIP